jgi:hypothetical protein
VEVAPRERTAAVAADLSSVTPAALTAKTPSVCLKNRTVVNYKNPSLWRKDYLGAKRTSTRLLEK